MNRAKLSKLVSDKMSELDLTQEQFAEYFSKIANNKVTYGFVQSLANPRKTSIPEYQNMKGIAKMYGVTLDELDRYLEDDDVIDIREVSESYRNLSEEFSASPSEAQHAILKNFSPSECMRIGLSLIETSIDSIQSQLEKADKIAEALRVISA